MSDATKRASERAHQQQAERQEEVVGHSRTRCALDREPGDVGGRHEQQHDHERGPQADRDQPAARVLARVVERLLGRRGPGGLVARELLGAARHRVEQPQLGPEEDLLHARSSPRWSAA